ncbi:MAG: NAD(P)/FAD-dependent oxidoreductase [Pseudomonadota bacterium]
MAAHASEHHVVVVGGGFGGLQTVHKLRKSGARITLIDKRNHHLFQPLLYQVATTILPISEIAWPLRQMVGGRRDVTTLLGKVVAVDQDARRLRLEGGSELHYDTLVLATGARHSYFGNDAWEPYAPGLKTLEDATNIRRRVLTAFEEAEQTDDPAKREALMTFAVIGAGPTGVELAGVIADLARRVLPREFRRIDTRRSRVVLIEAGPRVLSGFPDDLSDYARASLEKLGVTVMTGEAVSECNSEGLQVGDDFVPARTLIWAAGVQASNAGKWLGCKTDRAGRVEVNPDLTLPGHPEIFVIGDTASVTSNGKPVPGIAPAARQMGSHVAATVCARIAGLIPPEKFTYRHLGSLATIGRGAAVADFGRFRLKGALAWWFWGAAHIYFLIGTRSRVTVAWSWLWSYFTGQNSARLITVSDPVTARHEAIAAAEAVAEAAAQQAEALRRSA